MGRKITTRLIVAIVTTLLEEAALAAIILLGLPKVGVDISVAVLVGLMVAWAAYTVFTYRMGSRALRRKPVFGLMPMVGCRGKVVKALDPVGSIKIKGELWAAISFDDRIDVGGEVTVVGQDRLKLTVRRSSTVDLDKAE